jgi:uncharacterized protein
MRTLPLFPLHTVLFPGAPIQLHIFEERYREMIARCLNDNLDFGVVMIQQGQEALGPLARPCERGVSARIVQVESLPQGRMNLLAIGVERFEILNLLHDHAYLEGEVKVLDLDNAPDPDRLAESIRFLLEEYLTLISRSGRAAMQQAQLPERADQMIYACAYLLQIPQSQKQELLHCDTLRELAGRVRELYRKQIDILRLLQNEPARNPEGPGGFHLN